MPRNGAGAYTLDPNYLVAEGDTILPSQHNPVFEDLQTDANTPRPITAGGTGASSAVTARQNLAVPSVAEVEAGYTKKVATRTALKALDTAITKAVVLTEASRQKLFMWMTGDFTASVASDPSELAYIPADGIDPALGCWVAVTGAGASIVPVIQGGTGANDAPTALDNLGGMATATYDPTAKAADAFDMGNMVEATDAKVMTAAERTSIAGALQSTANLSDVSDKDAALGNLGGMALATYDPNGVGKDIFARAFRWSFRDFGAVGDGVTDDTTAINLALNSGKKLTGECKTYAVSGNVSLPAGTDIEDAVFLQTDAAGSTSRRTLTSASVDNIRLFRVKVDRNGDGAGGDLNNAAGIWLFGGSGHEIEACEVYGDDMGTGIVVASATRLRLVRNYVHDINYNLATDPGDDRVQGIWLTNCSDIDYEGNRVKDLGGNFGTGQTTRYSRAHVWGGCSDVRVVAPYAQNVDQGFDITGGPAENEVFSIAGGVLEDCFTYGWKFANTASDITGAGMIARRCGLAGFVFSANASLADDTETARITITGGLAYDTGSNGFYSASTAPSGFLILDVGSSYPKAIKLIACRSIDEQAIKTMEYGFRNQIAADTTGEYNEAILCESIGHTTKGFLGFHAPVARAYQANTNYSIPNNAWTALTFNTDVLDGMSMHDTTSNTDQFVARRTATYLVTGQICFVANTVGRRRSRVTVNGTTQLGALQFITAAAATGDTYVPVPGSVVYIKKGDIVRVEGFQDSGGALDINRADTYVCLTEITPYGLTD